MIRLIWLTDTHTMANNLRPSGDDALRRAVVYADTVVANAIVHTGDVGDNTAPRAAAALAYLRAGTTPLLWCNGNHSESEDPAGTPSTAAYEAAECWNMSAPFYHTTTITGGGGEVARVLSLDCNFYDDDPNGILISPDHAPGDRMGYHPSNPGGGYYRMYTTAQLNWVAATLAADSTSDYVIVLTHYPPGGVTQTDRALLADALQADGRPIIILSGHVHPDALTYTLTSTDGLASFTVYKCPATLESYCFTDLQIAWSGGAASIVLAEIHNYSMPSVEWTVAAPFTVADDLRLLVAL